MKNKLKKFISLFAGMLLLVSCGDVNGGKPTSEENINTTEIEAKYPAAFKTDGDVVQIDSLKVGIVFSSPFKGIFNGFLYSSSIDEDFMKYTMDGAFPTNDDFTLVLDSDETPIKVTVNPEEKTVTYKINPKFKWSNGDPVTTKDIVKTYEIFANQDYIASSTSTRFNKGRRMIVGIEEYNEGKADKISGLEVIDDSTMKIHLKEITPSVYWGGNFASEFVNAKQFEGVPMDKIIESPALRRSPLSYGPYYIKDMVQGEKVIFEANPYYYKGEPKIKRIEMEVLPPSQQVAAIKSGKYDIIFNPELNIFPEIEELNNINILTRKALYFSYLGFHLGKWNTEKNEVVTNPNSKMYDINLRRAMAYAIDDDALAKQFYHGLAMRAKSPLAPVFPLLHDPQIDGFKIDIEKAKKLLDDAGYKDVDGDGIREDKDGKPFKINLAMMSGSEIQEPLSQYYIQQWKSIGLNVELVDGRLLDFNNFYDRLRADDPAIDCFFAAFGFSSDPQQVSLFGKNSQFNKSRYTSETLENALNAQISPEAMDETKRIEIYHNYEKVFMDELPVVPQMNRIEYLVVNKRVKAFDWTYDPKADGFDWSMLEVTASKPIVDER
ncbi:oligopeptide ABC transporter substrate-binding protein [Fusobacterium simiae]|uniref:Oligopeptide ABC transporter substrate-binding protein n=1 Tax=Fusobacterium simiae TaxID=855 RepID=A0ABT4DEX4_FUSSI|nr:MULTISPECIES: oligopeptide ABC transporter substrate-binding protein [Fusobacterium]MCY7007142.1 oligopeptide ABC transporter substrate-binding protein [Fusobacterium simiae]MDC7955355.1 oligopeptide ABC transporter substrate-binding protein [Fusobacterium simiae]